MLTNSKKGLLMLMPTSGAPIRGTCHITGPWNHHVMKHSAAGFIRSLSLFFMAPKHIGQIQLGVTWVPKTSHLSLLEKPP